jgi:hypothetical protein
MSKPQTEFDSPWKDILELYFEDFIRFFLPAAHAEIDWDRPPEFLDKELQGGPGCRTGETDGG